MTKTSSDRVVGHDGHSTDARDTHVVVVGSGIAGLTTALHAQDTGCRVTVVTKDILEHANTRYAQGGIAGVMFDDDKVEDHIHDTLVAGAGLCDEDAVRVLVSEGPDRIRELIALGVGFDRAANGEFVKGLEAAHSYPRILHSGGDATGTEIEKALVARLRERDLTVIEHAFLVDLVVTDGRVSGVELLIGDAPGHQGERVTVAADAVVIATGGAGQLFEYTTNPPVATADGIAAMIRAHGAVSDLEFYQFHPTIIAVGEPFLISEAVRGEGAHLIDDQGRRFAFDSHPDGELAPRDVVARAIAMQAAKQGSVVKLDATALGAEFLAKRFPTIDAAVRERGVDWGTEPVPVTPAAHYLMGGITTDLYGRTSIPGVYATGECTRTGVHGANRLASNSLLEGAVFGARAGDNIVADRDRAWPTSVGPAQPAPEPVAPIKGEPFSREALQRLMWADAGLMRDAAGLEHAAGVIAGWQAARRKPVLESEYEDENLLLVAQWLVAAALDRKESVGAHYRTDAVPAAEPVPA